MRGQLCGYVSSYGRSFHRNPSTAPRTHPEDLVHGNADNILKPEDVEDKVVGPLRVPNGLLQDGFLFFLGAQLLWLGRPLTTWSAGLCGALCCRLLQLRLLSLRAGIGSLWQKAQPVGVGQQRIQTPTRLAASCDEDTQMYAKLTDECASSTTSLDSWLRSRPGGCLAGVRAPLQRRGRRLARHGTCTVR